VLSMVETKASEEKPEKEVTEEGGSYWEFDDQFEDFEGTRSLLPIPVRLASTRARICCDSKREMTVRLG